MVKLASLKEQIERLLDHPYLRAHIPVPAVDEDRLLLSLSMLDGAKEALDEPDRCITAMMLMQIALDTHEDVTDRSGDLRTRQLAVLAGDLYSGLFYELLARSGDAALIRLFAEAVREVNEQKVLLYEKKRTSSNGSFPPLLRSNQRCSSSSPTASGRRSGGSLPAIICCCGACARKKNRLFAAGRRRCLTRWRASPFRD